MQIITTTLPAGGHLTAYIQQHDATLLQSTLPAMIIVPGGSYTHIPTVQAETLALAFSGRGFQTFVLQYHLIQPNAAPLLPQPIIDLAQAMVQIKQHATEWQLDPNQITLAGFSVGGHIVSLFADFWQQNWLKQAAQAIDTDLQPQAILLNYPVIRLDAGFPKDETARQQITNRPADFAADAFVNAANPPTFMWHTSDDPFVPVANSVAYYQALVQHQIPAEAHFFQHGTHGLALANLQTAWRPGALQPQVAKWLDLALDWLRALQH
jgi:acetyl esterase/lipase